MLIYVVGAILVIIILWFLFAYNSLIRAQNFVKNGWADIDVQLKKRYDLVPNLVVTVQGYASHEKDVFATITQMRTQAMQATNPADKGAKEEQLSLAIKSLFAVAENYPELKASEQFTQLQGQLSQTEDAIQNARRYYNAVVRDLNTKIQTFPSNIVAGLFHVQQKQFFDITEPTQREPVAVKF